MFRFLVPRIAKGDFASMLGAAVIGAILAGVFGIVHDQITYTISPEYYTKLKFYQFWYANFGLPERLFVAEVGVLATWWVGFFCAWFLARRLIPNQPRSFAFRQIAIGCAIIFLGAAIAGILGFGYGSWHGPNADYANWEPLLDELEITNRWPFVQVAYIHNASYLGSLLGFVLAMLLPKGHKRC